MSETTGNRQGALLSAAALVIVIFGLQSAKALMVPFLLASFLALITVRPMVWMQSNRVPAFVAALIIVTVIMLILFLLGVILGTSIAEFTAALPTYQARLDVIVRNLFEDFSAFFDDDVSIDGLRDLIQPGWAMTVVATTLNATREILTNVLLIVLTMIFILLEASSLPTKIELALGRNGNSFASRESFLNNLGRYLGIKTLISLMTGLAAGLLTWTIGLDFPLLWALLAFLDRSSPRSRRFCSPSCKSAGARPSAR